MKSKVGGGWIIQIAETIGNHVGLQWKIVAEVARVSADEATITEAELMAARTGKIEFDLRGNLPGVAKKTEA